MRGALDRRRVRHQLRKRGEARIGRADRVRLRTERPQQLAREVARPDPRRRDRLRERRRMHRSRDERPRIGRARRFAFLQEVRDDHPAHGLGGMRRIPPHRVHAQPRLRQDVPERLRPPRGRLRDAQAVAIGLRLDEVVDAMPVGGLSRRDRTPEEWRQLRFERAEIAPRATLDEAAQVRHPSLREELVDHDPVGRVPADDEEARGETGRHGGDPTLRTRRPRRASGQPATPQRAEVEGPETKRAPRSPARKARRAPPRRRPCVL